MDNLKILKIIWTLVNIAALVFFSAEDIRKKTVSVKAAVVLALMNIVFSVIFKITVPDILLSIVPGGIFILISVVTHGKIGLGDGIVLIAAGIGRGINEMLFTALIALMISALFGIILILMKKASGKTALPFVPFILAGFLICVGTGVIEV